jgi:hypothetical protein
VLVWPCPWSGFEPPPVDPTTIAALVEALRVERFSRALVLTSHHQSPLPMALLLRMAGINEIAAASQDYPGSLLDVRYRPRRGGHEVECALALAAATGYRLPADDDCRRAVRNTLPRVTLPEAPFVVVHPGASVPWHTDRVWDPSPATVSGSPCQSLPDERGDGATVVGAHSGAVSV